MRIKSLFTLLVLSVLLPGLVLGLSGCSGGSSEPPAQDPVASNTSESVADEPAAVETPASPVVAPQEVAEQTPPASEPVVEDLGEQAVLTWGLDAGGLNHCDRLSIYADGRVEAVVCRAKTSEPMVYGTLDEDQLARVLGWVAEYSTISRREMAMSSAVSLTVLQGSGDTVPPIEVKIEVAAFATELFSALTGTK